MYNLEIKCSDLLHCHQDHPPVRPHHRHHPVQVVHQAHHALILALHLVQALQGQKYIFFFIQEIVWFSNHSIYFQFFMLIVLLIILFPFILFLLKLFLLQFLQLLLELLKQSEFKQQLQFKLIFKLQQIQLIILFTLQLIKLFR